MAGRGNPRDVSEPRRVAAPSLDCSSLVPAKEYLRRGVITGGARACGAREEMIGLIGGGHPAMPTPPTSIRARIGVGGRSSCSGSSRTTRRSSFIARGRQRRGWGPRGETASSTATAASRAGGLVHGGGLLTRGPQTPASVRLSRLSQLPHAKCHVEPAAKGTPESRHAAPATLAHYIAVAPLVDDRRESEARQDFLIVRPLGVARRPRRPDATGLDLRASVLGFGARRRSGREGGRGQTRKVGGVGEGDALGACAGAAGGRRARAAATSACGSGCRGSCWCSSRSQRGSRCRGSDRSSSCYRVGPMGARTGIRSGVVALTAIG